MATRLDFYQLVIRRSDKRRRSAWIGKRVARRSRPRGPPRNRQRVQFEIDRRVTTRPREDPP